ncbi:hypothetical protein MBLNU230_g3697t1 [Neophaeotheca triangularis]
MKLSIVATALMIAGAFAAPAAVPEASPNDIEARTLKIFDFNWCLKEKAAYILCQKSELKWIWDYNQCKKDADRSKGLFDTCKREENNFKNDYDNCMKTYKYDDKKCRDDKDKYDKKRNECDDFDRNWKNEQKKCDDNRKDCEREKKLYFDCID